MATLVINSCDILIRGCEIRKELQSSHAVDVKIKKIAWNSLVIAIDGTLIITDPAGISLIANAATTLSALVTIGEGVPVVRKIMNSPTSPTTAKVIARCQILCYVAVLAGTLTKVLTLPQGIKQVTETITDSSYQLGRMANEVQNLYQKHHSRINGLLFRFKVSVNSVWNRVFGTTFFSLSPERQALHATDQLMETTEGRAKLIAYLANNFYPLPDIYRPWYRDCYKNEKGLLSAISKRPVITPCRKSQENGEISELLYDLEELNAGSMRLGEIENNRVISQGDGKIYLDRTMLTYIHQHAIAPLRTMVTQKLEAFRAQEPARSR